jgi:3-dehydroquinate dehydratase-2
MIVVFALLPVACDDMSRNGQPSNGTGRLRFLVLHGPNTNLFGRRETNIYGLHTLEFIDDKIRALASELGVEVVIQQSNHEGVLVDAFQAHIDDVDGAIINPAGYSFSSVALHDVIKAVPFPTIEVHLSNLEQRDNVHRNSIVTAAAKAKVMGLGWRSYTAALRALTEMVRESVQTPSSVKAARDA